MKPFIRLSHLLDIFYPRTCVGCDTALMKGEELICAGCTLDMPYTRMHDMNPNAVEMRLFGRCDFKAATSLLYFVKSGKVQRMMHQLKYQGNRDVGLHFGQKLALQLNSSDRFSEVEFVVPVPLHPRKRKSRGFNQSEVIAQGMEAHGYTLIPHALSRIEDSESQTRKNMSERWDNVKEIFQLSSGQADRLRGKKVLLLDDVLTTGATLEACARQLLRVDGIELYIATIACAEH